MPPAAREGALLVDVGCGGGLLAPHLAGSGYRVVGIDVTHSALTQAGAHGEIPVRADAARLPLADACAEEQRWEFLLTVAPLVLRRGTASPVNPIAVF